ncbi:MAG: hypothetical protein IT210_10375 [Armatimonadetes bacterium]|nr:hypothetical protein [Armatimonadota bacterium]
MPELPTVAMGRLQVSRLVVGGNPFSGISHQSAEKDAEMLDYYTTARIKETLAECERCGVNTLVARADQHIMRLLREYWNEGGRIQWLAQTAPEMGSLEDNIRRVKFHGASGCYIHGGVLDQHFEQGKLEALRRPVTLIRDLDMVAGIAGHQPEAHLEAQRIELGHQFHMLCFYNITGRRGKIEVADAEERFRPEDREAMVAIIPQIRTPCLVYKVFAAGRNDPTEALRYAYSRIRPGDAVVMGVYARPKPEMVAENARIALECCQG